MSVSADMLADVRRMVAEPTTTTYSDALLTRIIEKYPVLDELGEKPYTWNTAAEPPTQDDNESWIPTYDIHAAAADVWEEKANAFIGNYDFGSDDQDFKRSQVYKMHMERVRWHRSRRVPSALSDTRVAEPINTSVWIGNLPEEE